MSRHDIRPNLDALKSQSFPLAMSRLFSSMWRMLHQRQLIAVASPEDVNRHHEAAYLGLIPFGIAYIDDLPTEVLQMIFSYLPAVTYVFQAGSCWRRRNPKGDLGMPALVCQRWRTIMNSVPFAVRLVIGKVDAEWTPLLPLIGSLECLLKERDRAPFDLTFETRSFWGPRAIPSPALQPILRLLFERSGQWRSVTFDCCDSLVRSLLDEPLHLPRLEHVHLDFADAMSSVHAFAAAPRLRAAHVVLDSHDDLLLDLPWHQLTDLAVKLPHDVLDLPPSLRRVLRLSTQLTDLKLLPDFYDPRSLNQSRQSSRQYAIPSSVRHLTVGRATLLDILICPGSVTTLQVIPFRPSDTPPSLSPILDFIRRSGCDALRRLVIHDILPRDSSERLFRELSELELMFTPVPGALHYEIISSLSPSLTSLVLRTAGEFNVSMHATLRQRKMDFDDPFYRRESEGVLRHFIESILMDLSVFIERSSGRGMQSIQVHVGVQLAQCDWHLTSNLDLSDTTVFRSLQRFATPKLNVVVHFSCAPLSCRVCSDISGEKYVGPGHSVDYDVLEQISV